jgi:hypothetical protein
MAVIEVDTGAGQEAMRDLRSLPEIVMVREIELL